MKKILIMFFIIGVLGLSGCNSYDSIVSNQNLTVKTNLFNVPESYTEQEESNYKYNIIKGQLNKPIIRARIGNEHVESSRQIQAVVNSTTIVTQQFRASKDNIDGLYLTLESNAGIQLDNFESYTSNIDIQNNWIATGNLATLETGTVKSELQSMALPGDNLNDEWVKTIPAFDFSGYTGSFDAYFTKEYNKFKIEVFIGDGINTKSFPLVFNTKKQWIHFDILESAMTEDQIGITNISAITQIGFRVIDSDGGEFAYIDNIIATPQPGEVNIELWDMGVNPITSGITSINDGTQYTKLDKNKQNITLSLIGGKRLYHLHNLFTAGIYKNEPTNELLNVNHYYLLVLSYIDTDVAVYGPDTSFNMDYYNHGFAGTTSNKTNPITAIGTYSDIMFGIQSMQDVYITESIYRFDSKPNGDSDLYVFTEDTNMKVSGVVIDHEESPQQILRKDISDRPIFLEDGGKLEFYYNDDFTDDVSYVTIGMTYLYEKPFIWG